MEKSHTPVLLKETIEGLSISQGDIYLDATLGSGFHALEVWRKLQGGGIVSGIDVDQMSLDIAKANFELFGADIKTARLNFRDIDKAPNILGIGAPSKILFDLGWNSPQFERGERGFSFQKDEPLLMNLDSSIGEEDITAKDVINLWSEESLATIIYGYGEEKFSRRIAKAIVEARKKKKIETSLELGEIVKEAVPIFYRFGKIHPATKTFQAIRIAVNDELKSLETGLIKAFEILKSGGRIAVISFHSLEDRIVKNFFRQKSEEDVLEIINKKPIVPDREEIVKNPRSRSAKLRIIKKI